MTSYSAGLLESYSGSRILITGGLGFIGSAIAATLSKADCNVVMFVRRGQLSQKLLKATFLEGDLTNAEDWARALKGVDFVMHLAAQTSARQANSDPVSDIQANVLPTVQLLETCRENGLKPKIVIAGTATQVGVLPNATVYESEIDYPASIYDLNKLVAEKYLELYYRQYGIPGVALRLANVYGPGKQAGSADRGVINLMIRRALAGEPLTVYGDGDWVRDYVYIDDVVSAFLQSGAAMDRAAGNHYLVGSGTGTRFVDAMSLVAERAESVTGSKPQITHVPWPIDQLSIDERNFIANTSSMSEVTGWRSRVTLTEGIDRTIKYYQLAATGDAPVALDPHGHRRN